MKQELSKLLNQYIKEEKEFSENSDPYFPLSISLEGFAEWLETGKVDYPQVDVEEPQPEE